LEFCEKKKENLSLQEIQAGKESKEVCDNQGDRWSFVAVLPESGFIHTVHTSARNQEEAGVFIEKIKENSDGAPPFFMSDCWFYEEALIKNYSVEEACVYSGKGRPRKPKQVPMQGLRYAQVHKKRNKQGKIEKVSTRIVLGDELEILEELEASERSKTINTDFVESRNGKFRKDNARLIRRTLCHSKLAEFHDASIILLTQVFNYTKPVEGLRILINENAKRFEPKYEHRTPAMAEGIIDKQLNIKELLCIRPIKLVA
jgi:hypothetical protein